jgi:uncharacterized protein YidB (DUF937 family)
MDFSELLNNPQIKGILQKTGVSENKSTDVLKTAMESISSKFKENPRQTTSLLSDNPNTEADNAYSNLIETDFMKHLIQKVGLSESTAQQTKNALPEIFKLISSSANQQAKSNNNGLEDVLNSIFAGSTSGNNSNTLSKNGLGSMISGFIGNFFGKK